MKPLYFAFALLALLPATTRAQSALFIDTSFTAEQMIMDFFSNSCVTPSNITFTGAPLMMGYFEGANTDLGVNAGIVISTGDVTHLADSVSFFANTSMGLPGDPDLQALGIFPTYDAAVLEFDITVSDGGDLEFQYVFGSEEYPEYVGSSFNDIFAFFVDDLSGSGMVNIALVPGSNVPVAINNVNANENSQYYIDYETLQGEHIAFDGMTTVLPAVYASGAGQTYHVKIAVSDVGDAIFDSGVFISTLSLCGPGLVNPTAQFLTQPIDNTVALTNQSKYATSWLWDFGDGTTSAERHPAPHAYASPGTYEIKLITQNYCCSDTMSTTVEIGVSSTSEVLADGFSVFPNPVRDFIAIQGEPGLAFDYEIRDLSGRLLSMGSHNGGVELSTAGWEKGMYILTLKTSNTLVSRKLFVQ
jgi:PKD repeat protein